MKAQEAREIAKGKKIEEDPIVIYDKIIAQVKLAAPAKYFSCAYFSPIPAAVKDMLESDGYVIVPIEDNTIWLINW